MKDLEKLEKQHLEMGVEIERLKKLEKYDGLPNSWKEYVDRGLYKSSQNVSDGRFIALSRLEQLRNCYNGDWKADWSDGEFKYIIRIFEEKIDFDSTYHFRAFLHFKTKELRDKFRDNFEDIIIEAKELL